MKKAKTTQKNKAPKTAKKKVYKAKPIKKSKINDRGRAYKSKIAKSSSKSKKVVKYKKPASLPARIFRKPATYISLAGLAGIGAFFLISNNMVPSLESVQSSVVQIEVCNSYEYDCGSGSGFAAFRDNYIVTNYHVIAGADSIKIKTIEDVEGEATKILAFDPVRDIAILEWNHSLNPIGIGSSENAKVGDKVLAIGNPLSESNVVSEGIISSKTSEHGLMTTAAISSGSSGGALVLDENHKVIGVTYLKKTSGESMNYAVRIEDVSDVYEKYKKSEYYFINENNTSSCHTTLDDIALDRDKLIFTGCNGSQSNIYATSSIDTFYSVTNERKRFEYALVARPDWKVIYDRLCSSTKNALIFNMDSTHSRIFNTNWKYYIWYANEKYYYTCQTDYCMAMRYLDGYYPTIDNGPGDSPADFAKL